VLCGECEGIPGDVNSAACTEHITDCIASFSVPHVMGSHVLWCCIHYMIS
jgi:hypothetical protein